MKLSKNIHSNLNYRKILEKSKNPEETLTWSRKITDLLRLQTTLEIPNLLWGVKVSWAPPHIFKPLSKLENIVKKPRSEPKITRISLKRPRSETTFETWNLVWDIRPPLNSTPHLQTIIKIWKSPKTIKKPDLIWSYKITDRSQEPLHLTPEHF